MGEQSELEFFAALGRAGMTVLISPFKAVRYDCVVDTGTALLRVQVKTGRVDASGRAIRFPTRSTNPYSRSRDYPGQVELFGVWVPELGRAYLVPVEACGRCLAVLRLQPSANRQSKRVRWADEYEVKPAPARSYPLSRAAEERQAARVNAETRRDSLPAVKRVKEGARGLYGCTRSPSDLDFLGARAHRPAPVAYSVA